MMQSRMPTHQETLAKLEEALRQAAILAARIDVSEKHVGDFFRKCYDLYLCPDSAWEEAPVPRSPAPTQPRVGTPIPPAHPGERALEDLATACPPGTK